MSVKMKQNGPSSTYKHPKISEMVLLSIAILNERNGSSIRAIKKHISKSFHVEEKKISMRVSKYVQLATASGTLIQTKGRGLSGYFRLGGCMKFKMSELLSKLPNQVPPKLSPLCDTKKSESSARNSKNTKVMKSPKRSSQEPSILCGTKKSKSSARSSENTKVMKSPKRSSQEPSPICDTKKSESSARSTKKTEVKKSPNRSCKPSPLCDTKKSASTARSSKKTRIKKSPKQSSRAV